MLRRLREALPRFWLFGFPLLLWMAVLFWSSGEGARYEVSWRMIQHVVDFLSPEFAPTDGVSLGRADLSMYQLNGAFRRIAHIGGYAVLSCFVVRWVQKGHPKLKRASLIACVAVSVLYTGGDELHRFFTPNRHAHWFDVFLNLAGTVLVVGGTVLWFWIKQKEAALIMKETNG